MQSDSDIDDIMEVISPDESDYSDLESSGDEYFPSEDEMESDEDRPSTSSAAKKGERGGKQRKRPIAEDEDDIPLALLREKIRKTQEEVAYEMDNELLEIERMLEEPMWANVPFTVPDTTFHGRQEPVPAQLRSPYDYFRDLVTDDMLETVELQTNMYGLQKSGKELKTTKKEIEVFIGLYLRMGLMKAHNVKAYWAARTRYPPVADEVARNRFTILAAHIHFVNNNGVSEIEKEKDKLWKIRPWISSQRKNLEKLVPIQNQSVDEVMVAFKGRSGLKQFMRNKPHRWGFKLWARAGIDGMLHDWDVYQGSKKSDQTQSQKSTLGVAGDVVFTMAEKLKTGDNFIIFADNFFSSFRLVNALKERSIWYIGTVRENRLKGCSLKTEKELKRENRGAYDMSVEVNSNTSVVRWMDNRKVDLISSCSGVEPVSTVSRYDRKLGRKVDVPCPSVVQEYNHGMGGVDLLDCLTSLYKYPLKSRRWYMYIFYHSICMSVVTAWVWYKRHCVLLKERHMQLSDFQDEIAECLISVRRIPGRPSLSSPTNIPPMSRQAAPERAPVVIIRHDNVGHLPEWGERARCKLEACHKLSFVKCSKCKVHLCLNKERNCFKVFHTRRI